MTAADQLPQTVRALIELVFEQFGMREGHGRLELEAQDGRLTTYWTHGKGHGRELEERPVRWGPEP